MGPIQPAESRLGIDQLLKHLLLIIHQWYNTYHTSGIPLRSSTSWQSPIMILYYCYILYKECDTCQSKVVVAGVPRFTVFSLMQILCHLHATKWYFHATKWYLHV